MEIVAGGFVVVSLVCALALYAACVVAGKVAVVRTRPRHTTNSARAQRGRVITSTKRGESNEFSHQRNTGAVGSL
jgi:hypothetical protein